MSAASSCGYVRLSPGAPAPGPRLRCPPISTQVARPPDGPKTWSPFRAVAIGRTNGREDRDTLALDEDRDTLDEDRDTLDDERAAPNTGFLPAPPTKR